MSHEKFKSQIAAHLKAQRKAQDLSLDATAKLTGVSKAMLGQIEREESSPTITTLWKIASGLDTSFSAFFATTPDLLQSDRTFPDDPKMQVKTLFPFQSDVSFEMFEITLTEHHCQLSTPHSAGVIEHIHVLSGELDVLFDGEWHSVATGESVRFYSDQPHGYRAKSSSTCFQNIVSYPR
ncbi:helix-turn-helix domain-containing protein [Vibrio sp. SCSIO 43136]|uniref:helix-turn-helix domain-containing protein n=1 Tax=Vibrio sp. SCSIO 43136 TaxID=2819101 RepID=UPI0020757451|nr:helix-turn-helix domain-containing protein [Vibrio sp. SCSIO 43136]USD67237.1 helix-turn-helix domain-containing protein [Vibrio sp. SCSIO 43136]